MTPIPASAQHRARLRAGQHRGDSGGDVRRTAIGLRAEADGGRLLDADRIVLRCRPERARGLAPVGITTIEFEVLPVAVFGS